MDHRNPIRVSLTALLGTPVTDSHGQLRGKLKDIVISTGPDGGKVAGIVLKTRTGLSIVPSQEVMETPAGTLELRSAEAVSPLKDEGSYLFLQRDLVDRQIIDINGRKVVRVNDVDLEWTDHGAAHHLRVAEVEVVVGVDGSVSHARIVRSIDPFDGLDHEAVAAAEKTIFAPGTLNGQPVPVVTTLEMTFRLH